MAYIKIVVNIQKHTPTDKTETLERKTYIENKNCYLVPLEIWVKNFDNRALLQAGNFQKLVHNMTHNFLSEDTGVLRYCINLHSFDIKTKGVGRDRQVSKNL